jgi:hypothetical protein
MHDHVSRPSAKIYQFPLKARKADGDLGGNSKPAFDTSAVRMPEVASCGSWYHEEAIQAAKLAGKR